MDSGSKVVEATSSDAEETRIWDRLDPEQKQALSLAARISIVIASEAIQKPFSANGEITRTLIEETQLDRETIIDTNKQLLREKRIKMDIDLEANPQEFKLHLTQHGEELLAHEAARLLGTDNSNGSV